MARAPITLDGRKSADKLVLGLFSATWVMSWIFVVPLLFTQTALNLYLWTGFVLREIILTVVVGKASRTLGDSLKAWKTPVLDFNYAIYYLNFFFILV